MVDNKLPDYEDYVFDEQIDENNNGNMTAAAKPTAFTGVHTTSFKDMMLKSELLQAITVCGFEHPSDVQQRCIPVATLGQDVLCQAVSGMGKTAVFVLSTLQTISDDPKPCSALILCHTRELAYQIKNEILRFTKYMKHLRTEVIYGGESKDNHIKLFKGLNAPHIVVGTPGRILDLSRGGHIPMTNMKTFVLDECDKLLDQINMRRDVQDIFKETPANKQVMMFTATLQNDIKETCRRFMRNPTEVLIENESKLTLHGLKQYYLELKANEKIKKLMDLIDVLDFNQVIIFVKSIQYATKLAEILNKNTLPAKAFHAKIPQEERIKIFEGFRQFKHRILVATEIFGRGIDIEKINIVFNFDMPPESDSYLHRVGRAGRFGTKGLAISFIESEEDKNVLDAIQKRFEVKIGELPSSIDASSYMNN